MSTGTSSAINACQVPAAGLWFALHIVCAVVVVAAIKRPGRVSRVFRHWYPLLYVSICYREMSVLIPAIRRTEYHARVVHARGW